MKEILDSSTVDVDLEKKSLIYEFDLKLTPLCQAVRQESYEIAKLLIQAGCQVTGLDYT